ncbi:MAG: hypothetical protein WBP94_04015 [Rhodomicrobiaceae bacterium]
MAQAADLFQILRSNIDLLEEENKSILVDGAYVFLADTLVGRDLGKIGALDIDGDELKIYRELGALPKVHR